MYSVTDKIQWYDESTHASAAGRGLFLVYNLQSRVGYSTKKKNFSSKSVLLLPPTYDVRGEVMLSVCLSTRGG